MRMSRSWNAAVVAVLTAGGLALGAASPAATAQAGGRRVRTAGAAPAGLTARLPVPGGLDGRGRAVARQRLGGRSDLERLPWPPRLGRTRGPS
jgi:hypothetical protein